MIITNRKLIKLKFINIVFSLIFFTSCELVLNSFDKPVKEFFLENTSTASINHHVINCETFINPITNAVTISSETDATVVFYMRNPQGFIFKNGSNLFLRNDKLSPLLTLEQNLTDKSVLYLKLPKDSLKQFEIDSVTNGSNKTLDFLIELKHPISNVDFQSYSFSIDCNSIPPTIFSPVYYQTDSSYVMAFNMPKKSDVKSIHNDLKKLIINGKEYSIDIEDGTITFPDNPEIKSGDVKEKEADGIQKIKAEFITLEDYQPFYFDTKERLTPNGTSATLSLMDTANFTSTVSIRSNSNTLGSVNLKINEQPVNDPIVIDQENDNNAKFTIIAPSHSIDSDGSMKKVSEVSVKYTLTNILTNDVITGSNNGSDSVTIEVPIGTYKLECISHKDYYADSITTFETIQINGSPFNFYVAPDANNECADGSITKPFKTIQAALDKINERNNDSQSSVYAPYKLILLTDIPESDVNIAPDSDLYLTIKSFDNNNNKINAQEENKVMTIADNAFVTLENVTLTGGCSTYGTGGVEVYGSLTLSDNCIISNNTVTSSGYGAGIYLRPNAKLTMNGGKITKNTSNSDDSFLGGGVYLEDDAEFVMNGGEISYNSAKYGGGVCVSGGTFKMYDGSISNNTANKGSGVYVANHTKANGETFLAKFNISGRACIKGGDDVYLGSQNIITITGDLSLNTVATITPEKYEQNVKVLAADNDITLSAQVRKFKVTETDSFTSEITEEGCLKITLKAEKLDADLYDNYSTIKVSSADGMKAISNLSQTENGGKDFAGKTIILEDNIELASDYKLIKTFSGVFEGKNYTIRLTKPNSCTYPEYLGGAIFNVITGKDAKVSDLNVSGEAYIAGIAIELENDAVISNCTNSAKITSPDGENVPGCGGIVGELSNGGKIENCINKGEIIGTRIVGGIVGKMTFISDDTNNFSRNHTIIANCANEGNVFVTGIRYDPNTFIGGICGSFNYGTIYNSYNTGDVTIDENSSYSGNSTNTYENLGGIAGRCHYTDIEGIINCYNNGKISSESSPSTYTTETRIGGIVGARTATTDAIITNPKFVNTVNNFDQIFSFGKLEDQFDTTNTKDNYYKKNERSPNYSSYESTYINIETDVVEILNNYSDGKGREYLEWKEDDGNIIFSGN